MNRPIEFFLAIATLAVTCSLPAIPALAQDSTPAPQQPTPASPEPTPANQEPTPAPQESAPASQEPPPQPDVIARFHYRCKAGKSFQADFFSNDSVKATFGSKVLVLPLVPAASGAKYSDGKVTLFTKGNEAFVTVNDKMLFQNCVGTKPSIEGLW